MDRSSLKFGTSGLRGLAVDLVGQPARRYSAAFLSHLAQSGALGSGRVLVGRDLRPSSAEVAQDCLAAIAAAGLTPVDCGEVPTPALALRAMSTDSAAIMVTGSHIPADRNGLKFYTPAGEITKADEVGILGALTDDLVPDLDGVPVNEEAIAREKYAARFRSLLPEGGLAGLRIGVFQHSAVSRDLLVEILEETGAEVVALGRSESFIPVDTEAFGDAVFAPLRAWVEEHRLSALVSADGDADRPLMMDERGQFIRGDVLGLVAGQVLGARTLVTPVTSNSAIEDLVEAKLVRTRVGSPYVIEELEKAGAGAVGFEANGGTFVGQGVEMNGQALAALPTRDAILPLLTILGLAVRQGASVGSVVDALALRHAVAGRLQDVAQERSAVFLDRLQNEDGFAAAFFSPRTVGQVRAIDGVQFFFEDGAMVHFRASGNAPELRCYVEAPDAATAEQLLAWALQAAEAQVR